MSLSLGPPNRAPSSALDDLHSRCTPASPNCLNMLMGHGVPVRNLILTRGRTAGPLWCQRVDQRVRQGSRGLRRPADGEGQQDG